MDLIVWERSNQQYFEPLLFHINPNLIISHITKTPSKTTNIIILVNFYQTFPLILLFVFLKQGFLEVHSRLLAD